MPRTRFTKKHLEDARLNACELGNVHSVAIVKHDGEKTWVSGNNLRKIKRFVGRNLLGGVYSDVRYMENIKCPTRLDVAIKRFRSHPKYERTMRKYG